MKICLFIYSNNNANLKKLLVGLKAQTYKDFDIIISALSINHETEELLKSFNTVLKIDATSQKEDYQKAFYFACEKSYDWIWCLRDEVNVEKNNLEKFVSKCEEYSNVGYFSSIIKSPNGRTIDFPSVSMYSVNGKMRCMEHIEDNLVRITQCSFASVIISINAIKLIGTPSESQISVSISDYFSLISANYGAGYLDLENKVYTAEDRENVRKEKVSQAPQKKLKICAVVVTYNRKKMLDDCIKALINQTYKDFSIYIIDNASTDGTEMTIKKYLSDKVKYFNSGRNLGGSGGFYYGMKKAYEGGFDWIWIMDDDVVPSASALQELVNATSVARKASFFASAVYSPKGTAMNTPEISGYSTNGYRFWYAFLDKGLVRLAHATFVSLLINREAISRCGLPCKDYFIWGDDTEYTMRLIGKYGAAYMVGKSKVVHNRAIVSTLSIHNENNPRRIEMYYYMVRNTLLNARSYWGEKSYKDFLKRYIKDCLKIARRKQAYRRLKIKTILKAIMDFKNKKYNVDAFNNRYSIYGQEKCVLNILSNNDSCRIEEDVYSTIRYTKGYYIFERNEYMEDYIIKKYNINESICNCIYSQMKSICFNERVVIDIDSLVRELCVINYEGKNYYLGNNLECDEEFYFDKSLTVKKCLFTDLGREVIDQQLYHFANSIANQYKIDNIILIKPKNKELICIYKYLMDKFPGCRSVDSISSIK